MADPLGHRLKSTGLGGTHVDPTIPEDYTIPFYVWGPGVAAAADLYGLNATNRLEPGIARPTYYAPIQPIRNGEADNLSLELLGLGYIPGSTLNAAQDLIVPELATMAALVAGALLLVLRRQVSR